MSSETPSSLAERNANFSTHGLLEQSPVVQGKLAFSQWLDLIRWLAALAVVLAHTGNRFFIRLTSLNTADRSIPFYSFTFLAGFGHQAVIIFFVLSGYLVGGGLWKEAQKSHSINLPRYLLKRVTRLCIVIYPALLLVLLLNLLGIYTFHGIVNGVYSTKALHSLRFTDLTCNAGFLQTGLCEPYGDNGALWSLYNEFWYYITWPLFLLGIIHTSAWRRCIFLASGTAILVILTIIEYKGSAAPIGPYMLIWGLGIIVAVAPRPLLRSSVSSAIVFLAGLLVNRLAVRGKYTEAHPAVSFLIDTAIAVLFANMLVTFRLDRALSPPPGNRWNTWLASFSFSLYCIHIPVLNAFGAAMKAFTGTGWEMVPDVLWKWSIGFIAVGLSFIVAYGFSRATEANTETLRQYLSGALRVRRWRQLARTSRSLARVPEES